MKKGLFGCLALFILVAIGGGYAAYRFLYLPGKAYVQSFTQLQVVPELNAQVANKTTFAPPAGNELSDTGVERFMRTQRAVRTSLGTRVTELQSKYEMLGERYKDSSQKPSFGETVAAFKDLIGLFVDAKRAQVDALNAEGLSLAEYEWTRARVYEASGFPIDNTMQQIIRDAASGKVPDVEAIKNAPATPVPDKNRALVQTHAKELAEGAALAFFGL